MIVSRLSRHTVNQLSTICPWEGRGRYVSQELRNGRVVRAVLWSTLGRRD